MRPTLVQIETFVTYKTNSITPTLWNEMTDVELLKKAKVYNFT
jgi:hypothetical protein